MFEQSLVLAGPASRWPMVSSLMLQATGVCVLLAVPLIWVDQLPHFQPLPPEVFAPRSLKPMPVFASGVIRAMTPRLLTPRPFTAPPRIENLVSVKRDLVDPVDFPGVGPVGPPQTTGFPGESPFSPDLGKAPPPQPKAKPAEVAKAAPPTSLRVQSDVQASKLIHQVKPPYPPMALQTRTQGVVRMQAIIARDGSIQQLKVIMGHPLLVQAAVDAVKQWRYSPTTLSGQPVEVVTQIDVNFVLGR